MFSMAQVRGEDRIPQTTVFRLIAAMLLRSFTFISPPMKSPHWPLKKIAGRSPLETDNLIVRSRGLAATIGDALRRTVGVRFNRLAVNKTEVFHLLKHWL